jgi:hypothetical protein
VWPDFSLLNHSCAPNTSYMALGQEPHMVVTAAQHIPQGQEVSPQVWYIHTGESSSRRVTLLHRGGMVAFNIKLGCRSHVVGTGVCRRTSQCLAICHDCHWMWCR